MRHTILILSFLTVSLVNHAQFIELHNELDSMIGNPAITTETLSAHWDVINISGNTRSIKCSRQIVQQVTGATHQFCWGTLCGPWSASDATLDEIVTLADGDTSDSFFCKYKHNGNLGISVVRFCWFLASDATTEFCHEITFCADPSCPAQVGVEEIEYQAELEILGNPASNLSGIRYRFVSHPSSAELLIYSSTGVLIESRAINSKQGIVLLDAQQYANGMYTILLKENGRMVGTQRLMVSK